MNSKKIEKIQVKPINPKPEQLDLFKAVYAQEYTNAFTFYESIPRFVVARGAQKFIKWNERSALQKIRRKFTSEGQQYDLILIPAYVEKDEDTIKAQFPWVREEVLEFALLRMATRDNFLNENEKKSEDKVSFTLKTTLYKIKKELESVQTSRGKTRTYSYSQIKEWLFVLSGSRMQIKDQTGDNVIACNLISDFGYSNKKGSQKDKDAYVYIRFNSLITESVMTKKWRQINYSSIMSEDSYLGRWLRKQLGLKFIQADTTKTYSIKLSTIIQNSGIVPYARKSDNLKSLVKILDKMDDIVRKYEIDPVHWSERGRPLLDAKITIYPTRNFMIEQIYGNQQNILVNPR